MISIHSYFDIDWDATTNNLKTMLNEKTTNAVLAEAMYVAERTIVNWLNGSTKLSLSNLIIFAKFLNVDLLDIIVTNGQHSPLSKDDIRAFLQAADESECDASNRTNKRQPQTEVTCKEAFYSTVMLHEYLSQTTSLQNLDIFLLYFPLFDISIFLDVLYRLQGNLKSDPIYMRQQLNFLCKNIPDSLAKQYADNYCYFFLTPPSVKTFGSKPTDKAQIEKQEQYRIWCSSGDMDKQEEAYSKAFHRFKKKLSMFDKLKLLMENIEDDSRDYV